MDSPTLEKNMTDDPRCCGTGTCIINPEGLCWCGQQWDGEKMCFKKPDEPAPLAAQPEVKPKASAG
jgi:hypothetical protein